MGSLKIFHFNNVIVWSIFPVNWSGSDLDLHTFTVYSIMVGIQLCGFKCLPMSGIRIISNKKLARDYMLYTEIDKTAKLTRSWNL